MSKAAEARGLIDAAIKHYGRLDILVNNSGVYEFAPLEAVTEENFHRMFNINVLGLLLVTQAAVTHHGRGRQHHQHRLGRQPCHHPRTARYTPAPKARWTPSPACSRENSGPKKIRVNSLNPGLVETEGTHSGGIIGSDFGAEIVAQTPLGRVGQPGDIAAIAVFLASDDSGWLTGEHLLATGGSR